MSKTRGHLLTTIALGVAAVCLIAVWGTLGAKAQSGAEIRVEVPSPPEVLAGGGEITVTVAVTATNLYGYQFVVTFDPALVEAVRAELDTSFLNPEYTPPGWSGAIDNLAGTVHFAATQFKPTPPASGSGPVARICFRAKTPVPLPTLAGVGLSQVKMAEADGSRLEPVLTHTGYFVIAPYSALEVRVPSPGQIMEANGAITASLVLTCENVYGYQFEVTFNPSHLEAQAAGFDGSFVQPDFTPSDWTATIDNGAGIVRFAATQFKPASPATGTGTIGWVRFTGRSLPILPVTTTVGFHDPRLASRDGLRMTPEVISGTITILPQSVITGQVELQGRTNWSGAEAAAQPIGVSDITDVDGWYALTVPAATYTVTVEMPRYLDASKTIALVRGENLLSCVRLLGGDANDDDEIDIVDIGIIGGMYDTVVDPATERADINADGLVDIVDVVLAAGNYTCTSPVPWP